MTFLLGLDLTGPRIAALFKLYPLPFCQQVEAFVAIIDVNEDISAIVSRNEAVPFVLPEEFDRAVLHLNVLARCRLMCSSMPPFVRIHLSAVSILVSH